MCFYQVSLLVFELCRQGGEMFEIYKDRGGKHRFRLKAKNGENIIASQAVSYTHLRAHETP